MLEVELVTVRDLPTIRDAEAALGNAQAVPAPGLTEDLDAWRTVLHQLARLAPWRSLHEDVLFTFRGAPLHGSVAVVIGSAGESLGIVLYPSIEDHRSFLRASMSDDEDAFASTTCLSVQLERREELTDADVASCIARGLTLPGDRFPRAMSLEAGDLVACLPEQQRLLLAAVEAVTALCARDLRDLARGHTRTLSLPSGIEITGARVEMEEEEVLPLGPRGIVVPDLVEADHAVHCGSIEVEGSPPSLCPCVVFKLRKADALKLARRCSEITAIELHGNLRTGLSMVACDVDGPLGQLVSFPPGPQSAAIGRHLASHGAVYLAISSGGPTRAGIEPSNFVFGETLPTRGRDRWS